MGWGYDLTTQYMVAVCDFNGAIVKALKQRALPDKNWAIYQLSMLVSNLHKYLYAYGYVVSPSSDSPAYMAYTAAKELLNALKAGTLSQSALVKQLAALSSAVENALDCVPDPVQKGGQESPGGASLLPALLTGIAVMEPDPKTMPAGFKPLPDLTPFEFDPEVVQNAPEKSGFNAYSPYVEEMCETSQTLLTMAKSGFLLNVAFFVQKSLLPYLAQAYTAAKLAGNAAQMAEIGQLMALFMNFPSPTAIGWAVKQGTIDQLKQKMVEILSGVATAVCLEKPPLTDNLVPTVDNLLIPFPVIPGLGPDPTGQPVSSFPVPIGDAIMTVVPVPGKKIPPKPEDHKSPFDPYDPILPSLCHSVQHTIDLVKNATGSQLLAIKYYIQGTVMEPLKLAYYEAYNQGDFDKANEINMLYQSLVWLPTPYQIGVALAQKHGEQIKSTIIAKLQAIADAVCLDKPPLKLDAIPVTVGQKAPVGIIVGVVALVGVCLVGGLVGLPALGINLLGGGTPEPTERQSSGGMTCNLRCDPNIGGCAEGLACALLEYQGPGLPPRTVCWNASSCSDGQHEAGSCWAPCDGSQTGAQCDAGLSCTLIGTPLKGKYVCFNSETCQPERTLEAATPTTSTSGQPVLPQNNCACSGTDYICTNADGTIASASFNSTQCGGSGQCECREPDKALACPDGTYAAFNPACGVGGADCPPSNTCGDNACLPQCGETCSSCDIDCGACP